MSRHLIPSRVVLSHSGSTSHRALSTCSPRAVEVPKPIGFVQSLLHGSAEAQAQESQQHSKLVGRGKYAHELISQYTRNLPVHSLFRGQTRVEMGRPRFPALTFIFLCSLLPPPSVPRLVVVVMQSTECDLTRSTSTLLRLKSTLGP